MSEEKNETVKKVWHNGVIKTYQIETSTEKAHLLKAKGKSGYMLWLPIAWFRNIKDTDKEMTVGFLEDGKYTIYKNEENDDGSYERAEEKIVGWKEAFDLFALPQPPRKTKSRARANDNDNDDDDGSPWEDKNSGAMKWD